VCPEFVRLEDLPAMASSIAGARRYILQQFVPETSLSPKLHSCAPYPKDQLIAAAGELDGVVERCWLRGEAGAGAVAGSQPAGARVN
jgi:hypothetical protein